MKNLSFNLMRISFLWAMVSIFNHQISAEISFAKGYRASCSDGDACSHFALEPMDDFGSFVAPNRNNFGNDQILKKRQLYVGNDGGSGDKLVETFIFYITCSPPAKTYYSSSVDFCKNAKAVFLKAASIFSSVLRIYTPIKVQVNLVSFCGSSLSGCGTALGFGKPTKLWQVTGINNPPDLLYPQALVKQLVASIPVEMKDSIDIEIRFNLDFPYYFSEDILSQNGYGSSFHPIKMDEYDFLKLTLHEMMHGLGIFSFFGTSLHKSQSELSQIYPHLKNVNLSETLSSHVVIRDKKATFQWLSIFDYTLHSTADGTSLYSIMNNVKSMFDPAASSASQQAGLDAARHLYKLATTRSAVVAQYRSGPSNADNGMILYTSETPFNDISSLMHADKELYEKTEEFLLRPVIHSGESVESVVELYGGKYGILGSRIVAILNKMGYPLLPYVSPQLKSNRNAMNDGAKLTLSPYQKTAFIIIKNDKTSNGAPISVSTTFLGSTLPTGLAKFNPYFTFLHWIGDYFKQLALSDTPQARSKSTTHFLPSFRPRIGLITLCNPSKLNAISMNMMLRLDEIVSEIETYHSHGYDSGKPEAVILTGFGRNFCSGFDVSSDKMLNKEGGMMMSVLLQSCLDRLLNCNVVSVAALDGYALGGGAEIPTACDFRVATGALHMQYVHRKMGVTCGWGGVRRLVEIVGRTEALRLIGAMPVVKAQDGLKNGLIDAVYETEHKNLSRTNHDHSEYDFSNDRVILDNLNPIVEKACLFLESYLGHAATETSSATKRSPLGLTPLPLIKKSLVVSTRQESSLGDMHVEIRDLFGEVFGAERNSAAIQAHRSKL